MSPVILDNTTGPFGDVVTEIHVEKWILALADKWFLDYLAESERKHMGIVNGMKPKFWAPLASMVRANEWEGMWPDEHLPCLMVMHTGAAEPPTRRGDGRWDCHWLYAAAIVVSTSTRTDTRDAAFGYGAAFRQMILQHKSLEHPESIQGLTWIDSRPMPLPSEQSRSLLAMQMFFSIDVKGVLTDQGTTPFQDPSPDPYEEPGDGPTITSAGPTTINPQEIQ